ncbi:MAG: WG repeat-containing protein [Pyrinomonadaceae bacterium]|nr:WG repeat-containing protein [Pyrinomonadaceae bacterium]MCX7639907.1 WG repeat-containing protein [Pyrinomonadaceae bacterium]MDW8304079.1 WG repeat-containing protein [Acidobacteriota bacterium]
MKKLFFLVFTFLNVSVIFSQEKMELFWILEDGKYGYIDRTGKVVIPPQFENSVGFREGLAATKMNGKYGYIDKTGKWVIEPKFDHTYMFSEGLAKVRIEGKLAWIDKNGNYVIKPTDAFEDADIGFSEGRTGVKINGKWGYIDTTGKVVIEPKFTKVSRFNGGVAQVHTEDGRHHWIDINGRILWSEKIKPKDTKQKVN